MHGAEEERPSPGSDAAWRALAGFIQLTEAHVEQDVPMLEQDSPIAHLCPELRDNESIEGANRLYELLLTMGADANMAKSKVAELYSPPRVTTYIGSLPHVSLEAGMTFDLRVGADGKQWDFLKAEDRARARMLIAREKPFIVIGSPPCTDLSVWNTHLNHKNMRPGEV
jgi:hypothetical protein